VPLYVYNAFEYQIVTVMLNVKFTTRPIRIDTASQPCNDAGYGDCGALTRLKHGSGGRVSHDRGAQGELTGSGDAALSDRQLEAFEQGWGASIMPDRDGWKVQYFSVQHFADEPGDVFASFEEAVAAISDVLPVVNSEADRARARKTLQDRRRHAPQGDPSDPSSEPAG